MQNVDYPASWDRTLIDALWASEGVIDGFAVTANGGLGISVSAGRAVVLGDTVANQGKYLVDQDTAVTLTVASVGTTRTEYVWLSINDTAVAGGRAGNNVTIETSTTAVPASALLLATLSLTAGTVTITGGMIADNRVYADVVPPASITTAKLADNSVTSAKIVDGTIAAGDIASNAVTTAKILDGNVTLAKLEATLQATLATIDPADAIIAIAGSTAPTGWALCDGASYAKATYPGTDARLSAAGYPYGSTATHFSVPNLQSRFIAGKGTAAWSNALNESGGSKDAVAVSHNHTQNSHNHTQDSHNHTQNSHNHNQNSHNHIGSSDSTGGHGHNLGDGAVLPFNSAPGSYGFTFGALGWQSTATDAGYHSHGISVAHATATNIAATATNNPATATNIATTATNVTAGVSGTDANLPPYLTLNYCIRLR